MRSRSNNSIIVYVLSFSFLLALAYLLFKRRKTTDEKVTDDIVSSIESDGIFPLSYYKILSDQFYAAQGYVNDDEATENYVFDVIANSSNPAQAFKELSAVYQSTYSRNIWQDYLNSNEYENSDKVKKYLLLFSI